MRIYVAAPWSDRDKAKGLGDQLETFGHEITHKWWIDEGKGYNGDEDHYRQCAINDFVAIQTADKVIILNTQPRGEETSGKAVEMGLAIAFQVPVVVVGEWTNVFHFFPGVRLVDTLEEAIDALGN